jgi:hypothetical protein
MTVPLRRAVFILITVLLEMLALGIVITTREDKGENSA